MTNITEQSNIEETFLTNTKPYLQVISSNNSTIKALLTFNDILPNGYIFPRIPDGLAAIQNRDGLIAIFLIMNYL